MNIFRRQEAGCGQLLTGLPGSCVFLLVFFGQIEFYVKCWVVYQILSTYHYQALLLQQITGITPKCRQCVYDTVYRTPHILQSLAEVKKDYELHNVNQLKNAYTFRTNFSVFFFLLATFTQAGLNIFLLTSFTSGSGGRCI